MRTTLLYAGRRVNLAGGFRPDSWFTCRPEVKLLWVPSLHRRWIPDAEAIIATAWVTAEWITSYPQELGEKFYLIQHLETGFKNADKNRVIATWSAPLHKIVISKWLHEEARSLGELTDYIPNGLDFEAFGCDTPIQDREPNRVLMLYHPEHWKGSENGLEAIIKAKSKIPDLQAALFGLPPRPKHLPNWIGYYQNPKQNHLRELYNTSAIFISPSLTEGWPLPPAEAAQCGAALCITEIGGHLEYADHNETALLSPPEDNNTMTANIIKLVKQPELRVSLAKNAHRFIQQFTWERAVSSMESVLHRHSVNKSEPLEL